MLACCLQVQQAESNTLGSEHQPMTDGLWYRNPPVFCPRDRGDSVVFVLQRHQGFLSGMKLYLFQWWFIRQCTLYFVGYFPFLVSYLHSPFGFSFTSQILYLLSSLCLLLGKTTKTFPLLSASHMLSLCCHLMINTLSSPQTIGTREARLGENKEFI